jgi:hypothetical protein
LIRVRCGDCSAVIAGLDPAIHPLELKRFFSMDARVKPGHDESGLPTAYDYPLFPVQR